MGAQKILNNRAFLLDSCSATVGHIRELRSSSKPDALQLLGRLGLEEDSVSSLARALVKSVCIVKNISN